MIHLRPADLGDCPLFWILRREIDPTLTLETHENWWHTVVEDRFVAEMDGFLHHGAGYQVAGVIRIARYGDGGILSLQVAKEHQGRGHGTQMLRLIRPVAKALGYTSLQAHVEPANAISRQAFLSAGYTPTRFHVDL